MSIRTFCSISSIVFVLAACKDETKQTDASVQVDAGVHEDASVPVDAGDECRGESSCWQCTPTTQEHFLNGCTEAQCSPFDNAARIPGFSP